MQTDLSSTQIVLSNNRSSILSRQEASRTQVMRVVQLSRRHDGPNHLIRCIVRIGKLAQPQVYDPNSRLQSCVTFNARQLCMQLVALAA